MCGNANVHDCANETANCRAGITHNGYVYDGLGFRSTSLSHVAERN
jgi:hypothetical protein